MKCIIKGKEINYQIYGEGIPLLAIHGFPEDHRVMVGCVEPFFQTKTGYKRIYLDLPGMGNSSVFPEVKNADDMLAIVKEFIHIIIGQEKFLLIGQSYGGYLALGLLTIMPNSLLGIFLLCPCVVPERSRRLLPEKLICYQDTNFLTESKTLAGFNDYLEMAVVVTEKTWKRYKAEIEVGLLAANIDFVNEYQKNGYAFSRALVITKNMLPITVLTGRQDDCVGYIDSWQLLQECQRQSFSVVDGAGHNLQIEQPETFAQHLDSWITTTEMQQ